MRYKKDFSIKFKLDRDLAYLSGAIIGDGYISSGNKSKTSPFKDYMIKVEGVNKEYISFLFDYIKTITQTKAKIREVIDKRPNRKIRYAFEVRNKWLYKFLVDELKIPNGKKSGKVFIPKDILKNRTYSIWFIAGLFDTDGGKRGSSLGFTTKSKLLMDNTSEVLRNLEIIHSTESWKNKKYNENYYGIRLNRKSIGKFLNIIPIQNTCKMRECRSGKRARL